ncbi:winged helix-turn-helix domain-containing protein [Georgenia sp. 10Sc9-8]|uniref:Winged helix-turn-helix domain-containing protein n=1 Tax=Georgenia halotolerans TaxID=3028317 RepID=A0ABT5TY70_9MICO|nr:winged helix-turn-helix domain-containing protein [Georgenia halotolerans]
MLVDPAVLDDGELVQQLTAWGVVARVYTDPLRALLDMGAHAPEVVVLSTQVPVGDATRLTTLVVTELALPVLLAVGPGETEAAGPTVAAGARPMLGRPYGAEELFLALREVAPSHRPHREPLRVGSLVLDSAQFSGHVNGYHLELTAQQFSVLVRLAEHADVVVPTEELLHAVWAGREVTPGTLSTAVKRVRHRLAEAGVADAIHTVRGLGYRLDTSALRVA